MVKRLQVLPDPPPDPTVTPPELGAAGTALWDRVHSEYHLVDAGGVAMLEMAARQLDRAEACRVQINHDGELIRTNSGPKEHPLLKHELACRAFVARTLSRLGLDVEPLRSNAGRPGIKGWSGYGN